MSWSSVPLTAGQLTKIRSGSYYADYLLTLCKNTVVLAGQVNSDLATPTSWRQFNYNNVSAGSYADVENDQVLLIGETNDIQKATFRGRIHSVHLPTSSIIYCNESSQDFSVGAYFWVLYTWDLTYRLSRPSTNDPTTAVELADGDTAYAAPRGVIVGLRTAYVDDVDASSGKMRVAFDVTANSYAVAHGDSISSYQWTFKTSSYTVISGALNTGVVTVDFNPGEQWGKLTMTTANGQVKTRRFYIFAHDATNPPDTGFSDDQVAISGNLQSGWTLSTEAFTGIDSVLPVTFAVLRRANENYGGVSGGLDSTNNIAFVGWLQREDDTAQTDPTFSVLETARLEFTGFGPRMARLTAQQLPFINAASPAAWGELVHLTPWRAICHFLERYTTATLLTDLQFDDKSNAFEFSALSTTQSGNVFSAVQGMCDQINAVFETASDGRLQVCRSAEYLSQSARNALTDYVDYTSQDVVGAVARSLEHARPVGIVDADGAYYNLSTGQITVFTARAPGIAMGEAQGRDTLSNQILTVTTSDTTALDELRQRAGNRLEVACNTEVMTVQHMDGLTGLQPSRSMLYTFTLSALDANGVNRIALDNTVFWFLEGVTYGRVGNGTTNVQAQYRRLPRIGDLGDNTTQIAANQLDDPLPDIGMPAFTWEDLGIAFPDAGLDAVNPAQLISPPGQVAATNGQSVLAGADSSVLLLKNFITLKRPQSVDITPSDLGNYLVKHVLVSPFFTRTAIPGDALASDGTNSAVWNNPNVATPTAGSNWTKGAAIAGMYTVLRATNVDGGLLAYAPGGDTQLSYDFTVNDQGWTVGDASLCAYFAGLGWADTYPGTDPNDGIYILSPSFSARDVNEVTVTFSTPWTGTSPLISVMNAAESVLYGLNSASGTNSITVNLSGATGITQLLVIADPYVSNKQHFAGYITGVTITSGGALARYSSDGGATWGSALSVGNSPGAVGGFDAQRAGANSFAAGGGAVNRATSLGGAYSAYYSITGGVEAACIIVPYFNWSGTRQTAATNPDIVVALTGADGSSRSLLWIEGGATPGTVHDLTPVAGMTFDHPNCVTVSYNHHLAVFGLVSGTYKLYTTTDKGSTWTNRGTLTTPAFLRTRRNDTLAATSGTNKGQLYLASDSDMSYSSKWASGGGSDAGLFPRTMPVAPIVTFDPIY